MKGFILKIYKAKNEDIIVKILTKESIKTYYRFYGARHSIIQFGYLIDFEEEESINSLPRLRKVSHIPFNWLFDRNKLALWQNFLKILEVHLRDISKINKIYYDILIEAAKKYQKQSSKRVLIESFVKILSIEGRLYDTKRCIICNKIIEDNSINLVNQFMPTHTYCSKSFSFNKNDIEEFFLNKNSINLEDNEVDKLLTIIFKGF